MWIIIATASNYSLKKHYNLRWWYVFSSTEFKLHVRISICEDLSKHPSKVPKMHGSEPLLPLSLSRFKSKIKNWIEKRKQTEWKVCEKYWTSQVCLEGPTDRYIQFKSKLDRKHCRMLIGLLTGHINLQHMLHKMRRAKTPSCRRCGAEKEKSVHILCECGKGKDADLGLYQDGSGTHKRIEVEQHCDPR